jgi:hypothetical protein
MQSEIITTVMEFIIGIAMLPVAGAFVVLVNNDPNLSGMIGVTLIISLGIVILGLGIIYHSAKQLF